MLSWLVQLWLALPCCKLSTGWPSQGGSAVLLEPGTGGARFIALDNCALGWPLFVMGDTGWPLSGVVGGVASLAAGGAGLYCPW